MRITSTFLICFVLSSIGLQSQTPENSILLYGKVLDDLGNEMIHTHIVNISSKIGTLTNNEGKFAIHALPEDTVRFSSVGYKTRLLLIPFLEKEKFHFNITLELDTIGLAETIIYPYPATLEALKKEFLIVEIEEETPLIELHLDKAGISPAPQTGAIISGPITGLYNVFSRHAKIQKKYKSLTSKEQLKIKSNKTYNVELVKKITGLKSDDDAKKFMEFCNLEPEFILNSNEYQLYSAINNCFIEYKKLQLIN